MDRQHGKQDGEPDDFPPDRELIERVRGGDLEAYDPLYQRHSRSALLHARHWARTEAAAEDLRAEAFTRVLHAIRNGNGPTEAFRPYLLTTMRHVARDWAEGDRRLLLVPDLVDLESPGPDADPVIAALERSLAGQAYMTLPERWQTVLWHTEVEGEGPAQLAPKLGIEPAAVAALAYRAREGLKQAYLQAHITEIGQESCRPYAEKLGAAARNRLGPREKSKVNAHLRTCVECSGCWRCSSTSTRTSACRWARRSWARRWRPRCCWSSPWARARRPTPRTPGCSAAPATPPPGSRRWP
jgi:RNA polymerase sigma factor (sigma-70 family)